MRGAGFGPYAELTGAIALCRFGSQSAAVAADSVSTAAAVASGATVVVGADGQAVNRASARARVRVGTRVRVS